MREHDHADRRRGGGRDRRGRRARRPEADRPGRAAAARARTTPSPGRSPRRTSRSRTGAAPEPRPAARLQLRRLPRPGHRQALPEGVLDQGRDRDLQLRRRGDREALLRRRRLRPDHRAERREHRRPDRAQAAAAAQPLVPAEPREEHLAALADPFYDRGSRYTVPYVVWMDGIGWRNDKVKEDIAGMDVPWDIFWHAQAYRGKVGILDDRRDALSMPMQRDAMRKGARPDLNTEDEDVVDRRPQSELVRAQRASATRRSRSPTTRRCPRARRCCTTPGRATCSSAAFYYLPKGVNARRALVLGAGAERRRAERLLLHRAHGEAPGARARVHQLHARREERVRQLRQLHRLHAAAERRSTPRRCSSGA